MNEIFQTSDVLDVVIAICIFFTGFIFGKLRTRAVAAKKMRRWDTEK